MLLLKKNNGCGEHHFCVMTSKLFTSRQQRKLSGYHDSKVASEWQSNLTYVVLDVLEAEGYSNSDCKYKQSWPKIIMPLE